MAEYYLISQLPSLDGMSENIPMPITEDRFLELCRRFLSKRALLEIEKITLVPPIDPEKSGSALIEAWNEGESNLRIALAKVRAGKMNKTLDLKNRFIPAEAMKAASEAAEIESPLEAEKFLSNYRLNFLETLRPTDNFSDDFIAYYALKLKLLLRIRKFDTKLGENEYTKIYNSILHGDRLEAI